VAGFRLVYEWSLSTLCSPKVNSFFVMTLPAPRSDSEEELCSTCEGSDRERRWREGNRWGGLMMTGSVTKTGGESIASQYGEGRHFVGESGWEDGHHLIDRLRQRGGKQSPKEGEEEGEARDVPWKCILISLRLGWSL
jgi:hypothetical protein